VATGTFGESDAGESSRLANLLDLQPNLRLLLTERLTANVSWNGLWKHAQADAYYAPPLMPVAGTAASKSRDIGWRTVAPAASSERGCSGRSEPAFWEQDRAWQRFCCFAPLTI
jgi:hypothetical protein